MYLVVESTDKEFLSRLIDYFNKETVKPNSTTIHVRKGKFQNENSTGRRLDHNVS